MQWSKYNLLFRSAKHGYLLYNALSNVFVKIDDGTQSALEQIRQAPDTYDFTKMPMLYLQLRHAHILVEPQEETTRLNVLKWQQTSQRFAETQLSLNIAPTLACNFNCAYCYESHRRPGLMTAETEAQVIAFIRRFEAARSLFVTWYGGEPLLGFETIRRLTEQILALKLRFQAELITNGYLLDDAVIAQLDALKIRQVQLTLDGPETVHDTRRMLASGGPTYRTIQANLTKLLASPWRGKLDIRVNVDARNQAQYAAYYHELRAELPGSNVTIYPGIVNDSQSGNPDRQCYLNKADEARFLVEIQQSLDNDQQRWYPYHGSICTATMRNSFVIGPAGELYKCWLDVGDANMVVGSVYENHAWNVNLLANYMIGTNRFDDPACRECFYLPICDGFCSHFRLMNAFSGGQFDTCTPFKSALPEFLERHYERKLQQAQAATMNGA